MARTDSTRRVFLGTTGAWGATLLGGMASGAEAIPLAPPEKQPANLKLPREPEKTVGWAVVGLGLLAVEEILPAFAECELARVVALVSGHPAKAKRLAGAYGVRESAIYNYDNYEKLADNKDVDVIYIVLPNSMHAEYANRGLKAGKHVLCEKPMAVTPAEGESMIAAAREAQRKLMIAYRLRYEPFNQKVIELAQGGDFGLIRSISASNCQVVQAPNIRLSRELGGGPLGDIGIYCLNAARYITGKEPVEVQAFSHQPKDDPRFREVPERVSFNVRFPDGVLASCDCSFDAGESRRFRVQCEKGYIDLERAFGYRGQELSTSRDGKRSILDIAPANHFAAEMDHFSECILKDRPPRTPGEEGLRDLQILKAIEEAAASGRTVALS